MNMVFKTDIGKLSHIDLQLASSTDSRASTEAASRMEAESVSKLHTPSVSRESRSYESGYVTSSDSTELGKIHSQSTTNERRHYPSYMSKPPRSYLWFAVVIAVVAPLFGLPAILMALKTRHYVKQSDLVRAWKYADQALVLCLAGMWFGVVCLCVVYVVIMYHYGLLSIYGPEITPENVTAAAPTKHVRGADFHADIINRQSVRRQETFFKSDIFS